MKYACPKYLTTDWHQVYSLRRNIKYACLKHLATDWPQMYSLRRNINLMEINTGCKSVYNLRSNIKLNVNKHRYI
jgi:hypothetical protein